MALIKCPECEKEVSNKAECCPYCGFPIFTENTVESPAILDQFLESNACISKDNVDVAPLGTKNRHKKPLKLFVICLSILILLSGVGIGGFVIYRNSQMTILESSIYNALVIVAQDAKNPSEMKVLQIGTVNKDNNEKMTNCIIKIQSTTAVGAINTEEIILSSDGYFMTTDELSSGWLKNLGSTALKKYKIEDNNEKINIKRINAALKSHWKDIGID